MYLFSFTTMDDVTFVKEVSHKELKNNGLVNIKCNER